MQKNCSIYRSLLTSAVLLLSLPGLQAAEITWQAPFNITSDSNIDTSGTFVSAINVVSGAGTTPVTAGGETIVFTHSNIGPSNTNTGTFFTNGGGDTGNPNLNTVLNSHGYSGSNWSFQLSGLSGGADYQIQLIGAGDTRGCCSSRNQRAGDNESPENISGDFSRSGVGSVIGTFTADSSTQTINVLQGINNGVDPGLSGYILRSVAPPTPQPPNDIALSNTDLAPDSASGTLIGTLTTSDPNGDNAHTYTFVDTGSFPDNNLFTIANGNELRAASTLGSFGASYVIKLRTTDGDSLTYDESLTLNVEAAMSPTALIFPANTVLLGTPSGSDIADFSTEDSNSTDSHTYQLVSGAGDNDNASFSISGSTLQTAADLPGLGSILNFRVRSTDLSGLFIEQSFSLTVVSNSLRINEFLANPNASSLTDEDGETSDWIELYNPDGGTISLNGYYLTDDPGNLTKWSFPAVSISGSDYLLVFASGKDRRPANGDELHTNFSLSANGEYLALVSPDGTTVLSEFGSAAANYPDQKGNISYGYFGDPLQEGFLLNPTPNASNDTGNGVSGFVADTDFGISRGIYNSPFSLTITTTTAGASIRYTTDGSWPSETVGTIYTGPISVNRSMAVKAIAYRSGYVSTNIDTHSYIIPSTVLAQTLANTQSVYGLPANWGGQTPYYGMNDNPDADPATHPTMEDDLTTVPSLSIALDVDDMFGSSGIYSNPNSSGSSWERKTSLELVDPNGVETFQQNCAIRIQGGAFRNFSLTRKKSFRVLFKSEYGTSNQPTDGPGTLKFPLFGTDPGVAREFQTLIFRMESNDGWQWSGANGQPQYARDEFGRRTQLALGQPAPHGRYLHLYINGVYWGLYNVVERPDSSFAESYIDGAVRDEWEGQNSGSPINDSTNLNNWNSLLSAVNSISGTNPQRDAAYLQACGFDADGSRNAGYPVWCDPTNNADYFITNWYAGNSDWPQKNYYGGIDSLAPRNGYKYFMWDSEWSLFLRSDTDYNRITDYRGIAAANDRLQDSPEFRLRFADRVHRAFFNNGPLTPAAALARYEEITADHTSILNPEAARWGNQHSQERSLSDWQGEYDRIVDDWFPVRGDLFLNSLRSAGLYPDLAAPTYSQHGGSFPIGSGPSLIVPTSIDKIYYIYGSGDDDPTDYEHSLDPRLVGGGINPAATLVTLSGGGGGTHSSAPLPLTEAGWLFSRSYNSSTGEWSALNTAFFSPDTVPATAANLVISEINYHPGEPSTPAELAVSADRDDYEFIELMNVGTQTIDLTDVRFTLGVTFSFADNTLIAPGGRLVMVKDKAAFDARYPGLSGSIQIATDVLGNEFYNGRLSNQGEQLILLDANDLAIRNFFYGDDLPWPLADGSSFSLVLKSPAIPIPDHGLASNWVGSNNSGGAPGSAAEFGFTGVASADDDRDLYSALLEYALGTNDLQFGDASQNINVTSSPFTVEAALNDYLTLTYSRNLYAQNAVTLIPELSYDLVNWDSSTEIVLVSETNNLDGTATMVYRSTSPINDEIRIFVRLSAME